LDSVVFGWVYGIFRSLPLKIAQITDFHFDDFLAQKFRLDTPSNFETILSDIESSDFDLLVLTGDLGAVERYPWLVEKLRDAKLPFQVILGNHDKAAGKREALLEAGLLNADFLHGDEYYYSHKGEGRRLLFLDSGSGEISANQSAWLKAELSSAGEAGAVIFVHHPVLQCGTMMDVSMGLRGREELQALLLESGKEIALFCGHYHFTHETAHGQVRQYVTPACIMQIRSGDGAILSDSFDFGYRIIELSASAAATSTKMFISPRKVLPGE